MWYHLRFKFQHILIILVQYLVGKLRVIVFEKTLDALRRNKLECRAIWQLVHGGAAPIIPESFVREEDVCEARVCG